MNPFIRKCTCGKMIPSPASKVDDAGNCEYCADDVSNSTRSMKIQNTTDACMYICMLIYVVHVVYMPINTYLFKARQAICERQEKGKKTANA